jgi:hypothetical protein
VSKGFALTLSPPETGNNYQSREKVYGGCEVHGGSFSIAGASIQSS